MAYKNANNVEKKVLFDSQDRAGLLREVREKYGDSAATVLERVDVKSVSTVNQQSAARDLHDAVPNADTNALVEAYVGHGRQIAIKEDFRDKLYEKKEIVPDAADGNETPTIALPSEAEKKDATGPSDEVVTAKKDAPTTLLGKLGYGLKEAALAPLKAVKWAFKKHPIISTLTVTALLAFLAYQYGIPLAQFAGEGGDVRMGGVPEVMKRLGEFAPAGEMPGVGPLPAAVETYGGFTPPTTRVPGGI